MKTISTVIGFLVGFGFGIWGAVKLFASLVLPLIPVGEWHSLVQAVLIVAYIFFCGGLIFWLSTMLGALIAAVIYVITPAR